MYSGTRDGSHFQLDLIYRTGISTFPKEEITCLISTFLDQMIKFVITENFIEL